MIHEEKTILQLSLLLLERRNQRDSPALTALLDEDYLGFDARGNGLDRRAMVEMLINSPLQESAVSGIRIAMLGDAALESGVLQGQGVRRLHCFRYSQIWLRRDEQWKLRGSQLTVLR